MYSIEKRIPVCQRSSIDLAPIGNETYRRAKRDKFVTVLSIIRDYQLSVISSLLPFFKAKSGAKKSVISYHLLYGTYFKSVKMTK